MNMNSIVPTRVVAGGGHGLFVIPAGQAPTVTPDATPPASVTTSSPVKTFIVGAVFGLIVAYLGYELQKSTRI